MTQDRVTITIACQSQARQLLKVVFGLRLEAYFETLPQAQLVFPQRNFGTCQKSEGCIRFPFSNRSGLFTFSRKSGGVLEMGLVVIYDYTRSEHKSSLPIILHNASNPNRIVCPLFAFQWHPLYQPRKVRQIYH